MFIAPQLVDLASYQSAQQTAMTQSPLAAYFASMSALSTTMTPARGAARASAEAVGYMSRRTLATIDAATRMSRCRTPKDLLDEQTRFWNTAMQQYMETSARMMAAWSQVASAPAPVELSIVASNVTSDTDRPVKVHDVLQLQDAKGARAVRPMTPDRDREAA
jgi:Phasin protein